MKIVIVRDRESAGGGIFNYYRAISKHLSVAHELVDVGRSYSFCLLGKLCRFPDLVHLNPTLDPIEMRSLPRDAVSLLLAKLLRRKVLVFWRGWDNVACGTPEFPRGNRGWLSRVYRMADAHIVLAGDFRDDLRRWGFKAPIHLETTVVADAVLELQPEAARPAAPAPFRILFLSRVEVAKGIFEMLEAFALLEARSPSKYQFTIAGDGPSLEEMKQRARDLELKGIEFKGYVQGVAKSSCYAAADVFCFPSY
ncbi:MAG: glycosyltransferase, partial [Verrucomicrobia bacterium]|nr:glycosyltransferase [Verrucomicrobiota bacterium]